MLGVGAAVAILGATIAVGSSGATTPRLAFLDRDPVVVAGSRFEPSERVTVSVVVLGGRRAATTVAAGTGGRFVARLSRLVIAPCDAYVIRAIGSLGSRASMRRLLPPCGAAP